MKLLAAVIGVAAVLALVIALRPAAFSIQRSVWIAASPDSVFALIDDFHGWTRWSPYERQDPAMRKTITGATGIGSSLHYTSKKLGEGRMTIVDRVPGQLLALRAEFLKPFKATNQIEFTLRPERNGTSITWAMSGNNSFVFKAFGLVVNMDDMLGKEFEAGLTDIKRLAETGAPRRSTSLQGT